jgi:lactate permease
MWSQVYDPFNNVWLSTLAAAIPVVVMLAALAFFHIKAHIAALMGLISALVVAIVGFTMPADTALSAALYGAAYGLFPIGWIILNVIFLYQLTERKGQFKILRESIAGMLCATGCIRPVPDCQYRASRLRRARDTDHCAGRCHRSGHA